MVIRRSRDYYFVFVNYIKTSFDVRQFTLAKTIAVFYYCEKNNIDRNNCFGLLVFCENDTMSQKEKYEYLRKCNPHISSEDYNYIISHIKSIPLYECEELCYFSNQQIDTLLYEWSQDSNAT